MPSVLLGPILFINASHQFSCGYMILKKREWSILGLMWFRAAARGEKIASKHCIVFVSEILPPKQKNDAAIAKRCNLACLLHTCNSDNQERRQDFG